ncbi:TIGR01777 family oxidoreductase [Aquimarina muelleri]|uniref:NAD-dependent epimerase n=1 Tax=Aquimarina muelleri TaxID=279356 RepID=A0A918JVW0_9FLAO|nr:TIGR01777 family oxidoreductase [Aquimarina muelleri]MCX2762181.1 TIGR01777 family oxidoreductase [Aquimarina muelleri]GGX16780.1 NAD-dependent epimerase [Aquimarina muelleri]
MKKIVIAAGTGFLGKIVTEYFKTKVKTIIILTRGKNKKINNIKYVNWDAKTIGNWTNELNNADVLINLTGKSVDCRYNKKNKDLILHSRIDSTIILAEAIQKCTNPPKVWLNSSTATIYRHSSEKEMDETNGEIGTGFSVNVAKSWEKALFKQQTLNTRKVALRTAIVLGKNGGALQPILNLSKIGFGGKQGSGNQKISWIHELDFARSIEFIIHTKKIEGVINIVSPKPSSNSVFMKTLRKITRVPFGIPIPKPLLEFGAKLIKTETELILKSRNVIPKKLENNGFKFTYPELKTAINHLVN